MSDIACLQHLDARLSYTSTMQCMMALSTAKWTVLSGYVLSAAGVCLYTQLDNVANSRFAFEILNYSALLSFVATLGGFLIATVGSVIWARRSGTRQPLKIALLIGVLNLVLTSVIDVNVHGRSAILMFLVPLSVLSIVSLLFVTRWDVNE